MKLLYKIFSLFSVIFLSSYLMATAPALTTVTITLTDSTGQTWAGATWRTEFVTPFGNPNKPSNNGNDITGPQSGQANGSGTFVVVLDDNNVVTPGGSQWRFTLCPNATTTVCTTTNQTVTGASLNLSTTITPILLIPTVNAEPTIYRAYKDSEVSGGLGSLYVRVTDNHIRVCQLSLCQGTGWQDTGLTGAILSMPAASQTVDQPAVAGVRTNLSINTLNQHVILNETPNDHDVNWIQGSFLSPSSISVGPNVVTLTPCPQGIPQTFTNINYSIWIAGTGTPEAAPVTASSCPAGNASGTVTLTAAGTHSVGYTLSSTSNGIAEAIFYSRNLHTSSGSSLKGGVVEVPPTMSPVINDTLYVQASSLILQLNYAELQCNTPSKSCIFVGSAISTAYNEITIENINLRATAASVLGIEINAQDTTILNLVNAPNSGGSYFYPYIYQNDNDQNSILKNLFIQGFSNTVGICTSNVQCTTAIGSTGGSNAGITYAYNVNTSRVNGVDWNNGNTFYIVGGILQNCPFYMIKASSNFDVTPGLHAINLYGENIGGSINPDGTGGAGIILQNGHAILESSLFGGQLPKSSNSGGTTLYYFAVPHSTTLGVGVPQPISYAQTDLTTQFDIKFPDFAHGGVISYDLITTNSAIILPNTTDSVGGTPTAPGSVALAQAALTICVNNVCTIHVDPSLNTSAYTVSNPAFFPRINYLPGALILGPLNDTASFTGGTANVFIDSLLGESSVNPITSSYGIYRQVIQTPFVGASIVANAGVIATNYIDSTPGAYLLRTIGNGSGGGLTGSIGFFCVPGQSCAGTSYITFATDDEQRRLLYQNKRPPRKAGDRSINFSTGTGGGIDIQDPVSLSFNINKIGTNTIFDWRISANGLGATEGTGPTGVAGQDWCGADGTKHAISCIFNNDFLRPLTRTIVQSSTVVSAATQNSGACTTFTISAPGIITTDALNANAAGSLAAVTGFGGSATGARLDLYYFPTVNNFNYQICNNTSGNISYGSFTINYNVVR